jgi:NADH:ubiquinone oxidoreductase subunit 4 (subunit M)
MKTLIILPIIGAISLYFKPSKQWALIISVATMIESLRMYVIMDKKSTEYQFVERII